MYVNGNEDTIISTLSTMLGVQLTLACECFGGSRGGCSRVQLSSLLLH